MDIALSANDSDVSKIMRLDHLLVHRGFASSRSRAQDLIRRGMVLIGAKKAMKTGAEVPLDAEISVLEDQAYVARSALKLRAALDHFQLDPQGCVCLDVGASTGGFTQLLVERGAARVYAVDVGQGQLHASLLNDPRIVSREGVDARSLGLADFAEPIDVATCDVSFISALKVLPALWPLCAPRAWLVVLVKPQFEVGRAFIGKGGVVKDEMAKIEAATKVVAEIERAGWRVLGSIPSPIKGQNGNEETLVAAQRA